MKVKQRRRLVVLILLALIIIGVLIVTNRSSVTTCTRSLDVTDEMTMTSTFKITYNGDIVKKVSSIEKLTSSEDSYLKAYKKSIESTYSLYKDIKYYDYNINIKNDTLITKVNINYDKIDMDQLIKADSSNSDIMKNGKVDYDTLINLYKSIGSTCK